jgi:hypothetical protein
MIGPMIGSGDAILSVGGGIRRDSLKTKPGATIDCFDGACSDGVAAGLLVFFGRFATFAAPFWDVLVWNDVQRRVSES